MIEAPLLALFRAANGGGYISRRLYVVLCVWIVATSTLSATDTIAWMWVLCVLTMLPPHALMSAIHGNPPQREDGRWEFLKRLAFKTTWATSRDLMFFWYLFSIWYGAIRAMLIIPAVVWLGKPWLMMAMLQGVLYHVCGRLSKKQPVRWAEWIGTFAIGAMI